MINYREDMDCCAHCAHSVLGQFDEWCCSFGMVNDSDKDEITFLQDMGREVEMHGVCDGFSPYCP